MKPEFASFGDPSRFEIAMRWRSDTEPLARRPAEYGWSIGDLRLTVAGCVLTSNALGKTPHDFVSWYLLPVAQWFADNWADLLHQADFPWHEPSPAPAVAVVGRKLRSLIDARDSEGRTAYSEAQAWKNAHALNSASNGGLLPDLYIRRYLDSIEMSWSAAPPLFAPDQFRFTGGRGLAYLPVADVAIPLWDALHWVVESGNPPVEEEAGRAALAKLADRLAALAKKSVVDLAKHRINDRVAPLAILALERRGLQSVFANDNDKIAGIPAVTQFSPAVAMYGGLSPSLTEADVDTLSDIIASAYRSKVVVTEFDALVSADSAPPIGTPYLEGYEWASDLLEEAIVSDFVTDFVDIEGLLHRLGINILETKLETETIRGVALAGEGLSATILINTASAFNITSAGRRFTLAHEFAHLLYDRTRAKSVGISSGPWAPAGVEKRANAFAAMLLMPRELVINAFGPGRNYSDYSAILSAAKILRVRSSALIEHLFNLSFIDEINRDILRNPMVY